MLQQAVAQQYTKIRATTSNQGELLLALYDALFRFLNGSKLCLQNGEAGRARELNSKAYAILSELNMALDHARAPELCANLAGLYGFCLDRLRAANRDGNPQSIADVIRVLTPLKEAWQLALPKAIAEGVKFNIRER